MCLRHHDMEWFLTAYNQPFLLHLISVSHVQTFSGNHGYWAHKIWGFSTANRLDSMLRPFNWVHVGSTFSRSVFSFPCETFQGQQCDQGLCERPWNLSHCFCLADNAGTGPIFSYNHRRSGLWSVLPEGTETMEYKLLHCHPQILCHRNTALDLKAGTNQTPLESSYICSRHCVRHQVT